MEIFYKKGKANNSVFLRRCFKLPLIIAMLGIVPSLFAQTFTEVTNNTNPVVTASGPGGYSGASWIDYDNDDDIDLFINNSSLFRNDGPDGNGEQLFTRITSSNIGLGIPINTGNGNTWADYDNDGYIDCFISSSPSFLYRNNGDGTFTLFNQGDIGEGSANRGWASAWADYNNDGYVDLAITHPAGFVGFPALKNHLFLNDGPPNHTFTRITNSPISSGPNAPYTVGTWSDFDQDGDQDYFIGSGPANGSTAPDFLFRNLLSETGVAEFERITQGVIATDAQDGQVWNWIDYDNDGDLDAYLTNWTGATNRLYRNDNGTFTRINGIPMVTDPGSSLSSVWGDFDNDGDVDVYVANDSGVNDRYYQNNGDGTFTAITGIPITASLTHRGASAGDYDNDGDLDLIAVGPGAALKLYRNDTDNGNNWININCIGLISNRSAIGVKVRAKAVINGNPVWQIREIQAQNNFNGQNDLRVHFGFGDATTIDSIRIEWPSRHLNILTNVSTNQFLTVMEDSTTTGIEDSPLGNVPKGFSLAQNYPNPFNPETTIEYTIPTTSTVTLKVYNQLGQLVNILVDTNQSAGTKAVQWNGNNFSGTPVSSGIYIYKLQAIPNSATSQRFLETRKMLLLK